MKHFYFRILLIALGAALFFGCSHVSKDRLQITTSSEKARELFLQGFEMGDGFHRAEARRLFQQAIALDSNFALAYLGLATSEESGGAHYSTLRHADELSEPGRQPAMRVGGFGISLTNDANAEMFNEATKRVDRVTEGERLWIRGQRASAEGDQATALTCFRNLAALYPKDARAQRLLGDTFYRFSMPDSALSAHLRATELDSTMAGAYNMMGYEYLAVNKPEQAEAMFKRYAEMLPNEPNPRDSYAEFLMRSGRYEESMHAYEKALAIDSTFVNARIGIAENLMLLNRSAEARAALAAREAVAKDLSEKRALMLAEANTYLYEQNPDSCLAVLERRMQLAGREHDPVERSMDRDIMGRVLSEYGYYDRAAEQFKESLADLNAAPFPADVQARNRANYYVRMGCLVSIPRGDLAEAEKQLAELESAVTDSVPPAIQRLIHFYHGRLAIARKDDQTAIRELQQGNPLDPGCTYWLGVAYEHSGEQAKAAKYYRDAMAAEALNSLAHTLIRLHAREAFERVQAQNS